MSFSVGAWISASCALSEGLSYSETIGTFIIGDVLTILSTLAYSCPGYDWKVGYTLAQRFVFGINGCAFSIIINYGSNAWLGGLCINVISDSWSHHYLHLRNTLFPSVAMTTKELISFFVYWGLCLIFPIKINVRHDDKDYYGAFTDEIAKKKGLVPFSEISEEEITAYTLGKGYTTGHEFRPDGSGDETPELAKTSSENTIEFEIVSSKARWKQVIYRQWKSWLMKRKRHKIP